FNLLSSRYYNLYPSDETKSFIFSAKVNLNFSIQDINRMIEHLNQEKGHAHDSWYYQLVAKAYQILETMDLIHKKYETLKSGYDQLYGQTNESDGQARCEDRQKIDYFRALRSLTTAHTLKTTDKNFK